MNDQNGRFIWYELQTTDLRAAGAFYTKVMGWGAWDMSVPGRDYVLFSAGPAAVASLMRQTEEARARDVKPHWIGYVGVDDVDATAARIERLGGTVLVPPTDVAGTSRFAVAADPQAARFALFKWLKPSQAQKAEPSAPGRVGWSELLAVDWTQAFAFYGELFGWQKAEVDVGETGTYQSFAVGGETIGGMLTKPPITPKPFWLYYFNIGDLDATTRRVTAGGGQVLHGPVETADGRWVAQCIDPQGAFFALQGKRRAAPVGFFKPAVAGKAGPRGKK
ncbi:MAG: VOC family protein [Hyphomicrobiales bacterium]|nr:VOC family protein [Hyphomicrobiales bacterium]MBV9428102.1 VOC family protein [Bradyrhizobiaceae bacterium]